MSLLSHIQDVAEEIGLLSPTSVINNNDQDVETLLRISNRMGWNLMKIFPWQVLTNETTFTTTATETQSGVLPSDFDRFVPETFYNRTDDVAVTGPIPPVRWQGLKAHDYSDTQYPLFRYRGGSVLIIPVPDAGETWAFEYISKNWCQSSGGTGQSTWAADTDTTVIDEELLTRAVVWAYKSSRGLPVEESTFSYADYFRLLTEQDQPNASIMITGDIFATSGRRFGGVPPTRGGSIDWP